MPRLRRARMLSLNETLPGRAVPSRRAGRNTGQPTDERKCESCGVIYTGRKGEPSDPQDPRRQRFCTKACQQRAARARRTARTRVLRDPRVTPANDDRYYVNKTTGWVIQPSKGRYGYSGTSTASSSYSVIDDCGGVTLAIYEPGDGRSQELCRRRALILCAQLNAEEHAWEEETVSV